MNGLRCLVIFVAVFAASSGKALAAENTFHALLSEKAVLEQRYGVKNLECFPFKQDIGFTQDQIPLIENCLSAVRTLKDAFKEVAEPEYRVVGISTRFLRTAGFHTVLVKWDASKEELVRFLKGNMPRKQRRGFLDQIIALKKEINNKLNIHRLYCSQEISNDDCLTGYRNLAKAVAEDTPAKVEWREIAVTSFPLPHEDPHTLALAFDLSPEEMRALLKTDVQARWTQRRKAYEKIQEDFGQGFRERLQMEDLLCGLDITIEQCREGAANLHAASQDDALQERYWGRVVIRKYNTFIEDDFNVSLRYDLAPEAIVEHFSQKPTRQEATRNTIQAEKLEGRTKNNPARLRGICDLEGLRSELCARSFKTFIDFLKKNREFRVRKPWSDLMFVDGNQLSRVNFALNSPSRDTYIYIDANSEVGEFEGFLNRFRGEVETE